MKNGKQNRGSAHNSRTQKSAASNARTHEDEAPPQGRQTQTGNRGTMRKQEPQK